MHIIYSASEIPDRSLTAKAVAPVLLALYSNVAEFTYEVTMR